MPSKIKIIKTPPGFAPEEIRKEWVGTIIPLATEEELISNPPGGVTLGNQNTGGYRVVTTNAIQALIDAEKPHAAGYWTVFGVGYYLIFKREVCELIEE